MEMNGALLVEGKDDVSVLGSLFSIYDIPEKFMIKDGEGVDDIFEMFDVTLKAGRLKGESFDIQRLGVVVDSNGKLAKRWKDFKAVITENGYLCDDLPVNGAVIREDDKDISVVGLWIMPDNVSTGMLEDFFRHFIPDNDELLPKVNTFIDSLPHKPIPYIKAAVRTWLACQKKSESRMGHFLNHNRKILNIHNEQAKQFIGWINRLFIE